MGSKTVVRAYLSYCQLQYIPQASDDTRYTRLQIILVGILTTLCVTARNDFLVLNTAVGKRGGEIERWADGMKYMKWFFCSPEIPVDKNFLISKRDEFFSKGQWWYDPNRRIARNHQNISNYSSQYQSANHLEESSKWKLGVGPRLSAIAATEAAMSKSTNTVTVRPPSERAKVAADNQKALVLKENAAIASGFKKSSSDSSSNKRKAGESVAELKSPSSSQSVVSKQSKPSPHHAVNTPIIDTTSRSFVPAQAVTLRSQPTSFSQIWTQITRDADVEELQMRERSRLQILQIELAQKEQRALEAKEKEEQRALDAKERAENIRYLERQGTFI